MNDESQDIESMKEMFYPVRESGCIHFVQYIESTSKDGMIRFRQYGTYGIPVTVRVNSQEVRLQE